MQFTLPEHSDWCNNMTLRSYNYAPVLPVNVSRPYFLTRPQGAREKFGVWGRDYPLDCEVVHLQINVMQSTPFGTISPYQILYAPYTLWTCKKIGFGYFHRGKLWQVDIRWSVIVGVNYIINYQ